MLGNRVLRMVGWSEVLVVLFALGLWGVWPRIGGPAGPARGMGAPRVRFVRLSPDAAPAYRRPDLIARGPGEQETWMALADAVLPSAPSRRTAGRAHPLPMPELAVPRSVPARPLSAARAAYRPLPLARAPVPAAAAPSGVRAAVIAGPAAAEMPIPETVLAALDGLREAPWEVGAAVVFRQADRPPDVFLDAPSASPAVNAAVEAALHGWRAPAGLVPWEGRVSVWFGGNGSG
jgi:hypothetical protein